MTAPPARRRGARRLIVAAALVAVVVILRWLVMEPLKISSDSMAPTASRGDNVLVDKLTPGLLDIHRGDIVAFCDPDDGALIIKRVVGLAGDTVEIRDAELYINGDHVAEDYVDHERIDGTYFGPVRVGAGQVFLLGDNRANSIDSRTYGAVPVTAVEGRAVVRLWPPGRLLPR